VEKNAKAGGCPFMTFSSEFDDRPGPVQERLVQVQKDWIEALGRAAQLTVTEKQFRSDLDAEQFALQVQSLALGYNYALKMLKDSKARPRVENAFEELLTAASKAR
jgi:hypothetical protein